MRKRLSEAVVTLFVIATLSLGLVVVVRGQETIPREQAWQRTLWHPFTTFNPLQPRAAVAAGDEDLAYELLAYPRGGGFWTDPIPCLASSWNWVDDHTFEIEVNPLAHFRKGSPVTAEDVVFSLELFHNEDLGQAPLAYVESIEAVDEYTVRVTTKEDTTPRVPSMIADVLGTAVVPEYRWSALLEEYDAELLDFPNDDPDEMDASGPYTLLSYTPDRVIFVRVDDYWGHAVGRIFTPKYFQYFYTESPEVGDRMYQTGEFEGTSNGGAGWVDFIQAEGYPYGYSNLDAADLREGVTRGLGWGWPLIPNYANMPVVLENEWLRHALAYAIEINRVTEVIWGLGEVAAPANPSFMLPSEAFEPYIDIDLIESTYETEDYEGIPFIKYDPQKAVEILEEHCEGSVEEGWTYNGESIGPWTIIEVSAWESCVGQAEVAAKAWSDIGIPTTVNRVDYSVWDTLVRNRDFDWVRMDYGGNIAHPAPVVDYSVMFTGQAEYPWDQASPIWYEVYFPEDAAIVKDRLDKMLSLPVDSAEYIAYAKEIQSIIVPQLPIIPVVQRAWDPYWYAENWANWMWYDDEPYPVGVMLGVPCWQTMVLHQPAKVETVDFTLTPSVVEIGETAVASVTLRNTGEYEQLYRLEISRGPATPGPGPEIIAFKGVTVPAGETVTVDLDILIEETGSYILTVDDWRVGKYDPGDPIERALSVTPPAIIETVTETETETVTETETTTTDRIVPTLDMTTLAGAGIVTLIVGVVVGWLVGSRRS